MTTKTVVYHAERVIGCGRYAKVYEATRSTTLSLSTANDNERGETDDHVAPMTVRDKVAVKVYKRRDDGDERKTRDLFDNECRMLEQIAGHRNVIELVDRLDETSGQLGIVMELVQGENLLDFIRSQPNTRLDESVARHVFGQIVEALCHCHRVSIAHRDIKPENIMVRNHCHPLTGGPDVVLVDFGYAQVCTDCVDTFKGSLTHSAPEVVQRIPHDALLADCWSLGVTLFEILCGCLPFDGTTEYEVYTKIVSCDRCASPVVLSRRVLDVIDRCLLVVNPVQRSTADELMRHEWTLFGSDLFGDVSYFSSSSRSAGDALALGDGQDEQTINTLLCDYVSRMMTMVSPTYAASESGGGGCGGGGDDDDRRAQASQCESRATTSDDEACAQRTLEHRHSVVINV